MLVVAAVVTALDTLGRAAWSWSTAPVPEHPQRAAARMQSRLVALPAAVERSRRLPVAVFGPLTRGEAGAVLTVLGERQQRWFPADAVGWTSLGRAAVLLDRVPEGLEDFQRALVRDPTSPWLHRLVAVVQYALGRSDEATTELVEAIAIAPTVTRPTLDLGKEKMAEVEIAAARRRLELYPRRRVTGVTELVDQLLAAGKDDEALALLAAEPTHPTVTTLLGRLELERGSVASAMARLETVANNRTYPRRERAEALALMARGAELEGDTDAAMRFAQQALDEGSDLPAPYQALSQLAAARGDDQAAFTYLRRARGLAPTNVRLLIQLGAAAERVGEIDEATNALERAAALAPNDPRIVASLVDFQLRNGKLSAAAAVLGDALDRFPADARLLRLAERLRREVVGPSRGRKRE